MEITNTDNIFELGKRVYNGQMMVKKDKQGEDFLSDEEGIKALCSKVFDEDGGVISFENLHSFNRIITRVADEIAQPRVEEMLKLFANYKTAKRGDVAVTYDLPKIINKSTLKWSALGSGVDLQRLNSTTGRVPAVPVQIQFGAYYEPLDMVVDSVNKFREAVNKVADSKVEMYFTKTMELVRNAANSGTMPVKQVIKQANITLKDYQKLENQMMRLGGRPLFFGDYLLINHFAEQQATDAYYSKLLTDEVRTGLLRDLNATAFSKTIAINIDNPFIDKNNTKVKFSENEGYIFAGVNGSDSPIYITEFGQMRVLEEKQDTQTERIVLVMKQEVDITLISARTMGYVKDDSVIL